MRLARPLLPILTLILATPAFAQETPVVGPLAPELAPSGSDLSVSLGADLVTAYYFRGILQEDRGVIVQPWAELRLPFAATDAMRFEAIFALWNSFHSEATGAGTDDGFLRGWYEADLVAGVGVGCGAWSIDATYVAYTSPSDAFDTLQELILSVGVEDPWSLAPHAAIGFELGSDGALGDPGIYLELGIEPGFEVPIGDAGALGISFPITIGLGLDDYYENPGGGDELFGYLDVGAVAAWTLPGDGALGAWTLTGAANLLLLGDANRAVNGDENVEIVGRLGLSIAF